MMERLQSLAWIALGGLLGILLFWSAVPAHAYPEYTDRTGQQCTACHVNPAGGGPRTLRGLLWIAEGRPDEIPLLPGGDQADVAALDGPTRYNQFECNRCHGSVGEGGIAAPLNQTEWTSEELTEILRNGIGAMNGYPPEVMSDEEMATLIPYVQAIGRGEVEASVVLNQRPLPAPPLDCGAEAELEPILFGCTGN